MSHLRNMIMLAMVIAAPALAQTQTRFTRDVVVEMTEPLPQNQEPDSLYYAFVLRNGIWKPVDGRSGFLARGPMEFMVRFEASGPDGAKKLDDVITRLQAVPKSGLTPEQAKQRLAEIQPQIDKIKADLQMFSDLRQARQKIWPDILADRMKDGELTKRRLDMDLAAKETRSKVLREQIKQIDQELQQKVKDDPILGQLQKVLELRKREVARFNELRRGNLVSEQDVDKGEEQLLESQIRVQERMEALRQNPRGELLGRLSGELGMVMVDIAEMQTKRDFLEKELAQIDVSQLDEQKLQRLREQYRDFTSPVDAPAEKRLVDLRTDLSAEEMKLMIKNIRPANPDDATRINAQKR